MDSFCLYSARTIWLGLALWIGLACPSARAANDAALRQLLDQGQETPIAFVEATSKALLRSGQIDFSAAIELDLPAKAMRLELDEWFAAPADQAPRYAIVLDVALARTNRRVVGLKPQNSTMFMGFEGDNLAGPVGRPIVVAYAYDLAKLRARRTLSAYVYVIDRVRQTYIATTVDVHEERNFEVAYRVSGKDPRRQQIVTRHHTEQDVDDFEHEELLIKLSAILTDALAKAEQAKPYQGQAGLRRVLAARQAKTLERVEANRFDARPLNDPRFDCVVAIYTGKASLGSGFYVTPEVVMTNWHVVEDHAIVEMKMYDGRETYGEVLGKDARLDVALIRVQDRGRPVAFLTGRGLQPGQRVEAIGHPERLEFSITRGVVSAIRKHPSINLPKWSGEDVLYVQTDTPVNRGNSGGPLFRGERVVGMNTWGVRKDMAEGLNFAVHYAELLDFLNEHLPGYRVDPTQGDRP